MEISVYKDHISFINHNRPLPPVTREDLNTKVEFKDRNYLNDELKAMIWISAFYMRFTRMLFTDRRSFILCTIH